MGVAKLPFALFVQPDASCRGLVAAAGGERPEKRGLLAGSGRLGRRASGRVSRSDAFGEAYGPRPARARVSATHRRPPFVARDKYGGNHARGAPLIVLLLRSQDIR